MENALWTSFLVVVLAILLATTANHAVVAAAARFEVAGLVTAGTTLGMLVADGLVVFGGAHLTRLVPPTLLRRAGSALFLALGLIALAGVLARD